MARTKRSGGQSGTAGAVSAHGQWRARVQAVRGESVLARSEHTAPLKVAKPFRGPAGELVIYLMDASPGLFGGDVQDLECELQRGTSLYLTTQSACKVHPDAGGNVARQTQRFCVDEDAVLEYFPEPLVPFADADYYGEMSVWLQSGAQALIGEVITAGRIGRGESFAYRRIVSRFSAYWESELMVHDVMNLEPDRWNERSAIFAGFTHLATLWVLSDAVSNVELDILREILSDAQLADQVYGGCSRLQRGGLVVRMLGHSSWVLQEVLRRCWDELRPRMLGRPPLHIRK